MIAVVAQSTQSGELQAPEIVWSLVWPFVVLALGGILLVTITSVAPRLRGGGFPAAFTGLSAVLAGALTVPVWNRVNTSVAQADQTSEGPQRLIAGAVSVDAFTVFVTAVICLSVLLAALLLDAYLRRENLDGPEWYVLLLMSAAGGVLLASAEDLIVAFLGLEILSIAAYVMAALHLRRAESQEAGFKYFLLGALASAFFLYGIAMVYGATGSTSLPDIAAARENAAGLSPLSESSLILVGMAMLLVGFAFKVAAVPFHYWTPDVYQGSPSPVVAYMASGIKVAGFAGLARVFLIGFEPYVADWRPMLGVLAVLSMVVGGVTALVQTNVKRMLAYSSINHAGFMLLALHAAASPGRTELAGGEALLFYMVAYTVMVAGTFGVVTIVSGRGDGRHDLADYRGLSRRQPVLAGCMAILLFAQAGVPFTSGFFAKFRVIIAAAADESYLLAGIAMLAAVVSAVLYLRIVVSMFLVDDPAEPTGDGAAAPATSRPAGDVLVETESDVLTAAPVRPPVTAMATVLATAGVTLLLGVLPGLGSGVLADAANALIRLVAAP
jgi:NADH-quinone oxidoreductase subunit N